VLRKLAPSDERLTDLESLAAALSGARAAETSDMSISGPREEMIGAL
jgi:hypothetical protein